jgi:hypothetical protein
MVAQRVGKAMLVVLLLVNLAARAADAGEEDGRRTKGSDPSEIVSRLEVRNEYLDLPEGGHSDATVFRGDWAFARHFLGRLEIPLVTAKTEHGAATGMGDLFVGLRGKLELSERWSLLGEMSFAFDTAAADVLGTGRTQAEPFGVVVWKPAPAWVLGLQYQWIGSIDGSSDREAIRESVIRPQALWHLPEGFWVFADPRIYLDHHQGGDVAFFPEGEVGNVVTEHVELWVRGGGRVTGDGREERLGWKAEAGVRYLFDEPS